MNTPQEAADHAAEGVRALNHLTLWDGGYRWPSDVANVLADLRLMAERLSQALDQAAAWLEDEDRDGRVGRDQTIDPAFVRHAVSDCSAQLADAATAALTLAAALTAAQNTASHLIG